MILIDNGKKPDDPLSVTLCFPLPSDTPYGNFMLKSLKIIYRLDEANRRIVESFDLWKKMPRKETDDMSEDYSAMHILAIEQAIYLIRRACDEIISLIWCLDYVKKNNGQYPSKIGCDCIGSVVSQKTEYKNINPFSNHLELLNLLNEISNAYKHSFINTENNLIGKYEPCIYALGLKNNKLSSKPEFYSVSLNGFVEKFNAFYIECVRVIRGYSSI